MRQNLITKLQKVLVHWLNLADITSLFMRQKSKCWGSWESGGGIWPCNLEISLCTKAFRSIPTDSDATETTWFYPQCQQKCADITFGVLKSVSSHQVPSNHTLRVTETIRKLIPFCQEGKTPNSYENCCLGAKILLLVLEHNFNMKIYLNAEMVQ